MRPPPGATITRVPAGWVWCVCAPLYPRGGPGAYAGLTHGTAPLPSRRDAEMHALLAVHGIPPAARLLVGGGA